MKSDISFKNQKFSVANSIPHNRLNYRFPYFERQLVKEAFSLPINVISFSFFFLNRFRFKKIFFHVSVTSFIENLLVIF